MGKPFLHSLNYTSVKSQPDTTKSSPFRQLGRDILVYTPTKLIPSIVGVLSIFLYTRHFSPQEYGELSLVLTTISFVSTFAFTWTGYVLIRYFERHKNSESVPVLLSTLALAIIGLFVLVSILWLSAILLLNAVLQTTTVRLFVIGLVSLGSQALYTFILSILLLDERGLRYNLHTLLNTVGAFLLSLVLISYFSFGVEAILLANTLFAFLSILIEAHYLIHSWQVRPKHFSLKLLNQSIRFGLPQVGIVTAALILSVFDRYLLGFFRGSTEVGIYSASYKIAEMSVLFPLGIMSLVAGPLLVRTYENLGLIRTQELLRQIFALYLVVFAPVTVGVIAFSSHIVVFLLGTAFREAAVVLPLVVLGAFFFGFSQFENMPFQLKEQPVTLLYLIGISSVINILLNIGLIPFLGSLGAAWATFIAYFVYAAISYIYVNRLFKLNFPGATTLKVAVALVGMTSVLILLVDFPFTIAQILFSLSLATSVYLLILVLLKEEMIQLVLAKTVTFRGKLIS